jgi:hypothetical protein
MLRRAQLLYKQPLTLSLGKVISPIKFVTEKTQSRRAKAKYSVSPLAYINLSQ